MPALHFTVLNTAETKDENMRRNVLLSIAALLLLSQPVQASESELRDWLWYYATHDCEQTPDQRTRRFNLLVDLLDSSGGQAPAIRMISLSCLGAGQEKVVRTLEFKTYLQDIERRIRHLSGFEKAAELAPTVLTKGQTMAYAIFIENDGFLKELRLTKGSGSKELDDLVATGIKNGFGSGEHTPFKKLPYSMEQTHILAQFYLNQNHKLEFAMLPVGNYGGPIVPGEITPR